MSPNSYYNYKKDAKRDYPKRFAGIFELIKYVYYNNNHIIDYRVIRIFMKRYSYVVFHGTQRNRSQAGYVISVNLRYFQAPSE